MEPPPLDPVIHQASRLRILALLYRNRELAFTTIRNLLGFTDGNLASHLSRLDAAGYVRTGRVLVALSFEVHAKITQTGSAAFRAYLAQLRGLLEAAEPGASPSVPEAPGPGVVDLGREHVS